MPADRCFNLTIQLFIYLFFGNEFCFLSCMGSLSEGSSLYRCLCSPVSLQIIINHVAGPQMSQAWPDGNQAAGPEGKSLVLPTLPLLFVWFSLCSASGMSWLGEGYETQSLDPHMLFGLGN